MSLKIKQATAEDASFLAQMILQSSRAGKKKGLFDVLFGTDNDTEVLEKLQKLTQTQSKSHCHYKNFLIAQMDGKSVGSLCSYEPRIATKEAFEEALKEIGCGDEIQKPLEVVYECSFNTSKSRLMFDFMEELEGFIDVGVLKALMQKSLLTARLKGYSIVQTVIEIGSLEAELFYKRLGFEIVDKKECDAYREIFGRAGVMLLAMEF
ncbi:acyl-CoA acyltransferase [Sulfurimonas sp. NWX367]